MHILRWDNATKSLRLDDLPPEAWKIITGTDGPAGNVYQLYTRVPWLYRGVNLRAEAVAGVPVKLLRGETEIDQPEKALPWWDQLSDILDGIAADRTIYGASYNILEQNQYGGGQRVRRLLPTTIMPRATETDGLIGWKRSVGGKVVEFALEDLIWSWVPSREKEIGPGIPPARAAVEAAGLIQHADQFASAYFARGAIGGLLIDVEEGGASDADMTRLQEWIQRRVLGIKNAFSANVGRRKLNVHELGQKTGDLALPELTDKKREDISTALGIPHSLLFSNAANYATARQDMLTFYDTTIVPECHKIAAALNRWLLAPLGYRLEFAPEKLEVYQQQEATKAEHVTRLFVAGVITKNEAREQMNYELLPETPDVEEPKQLEAPQIVDGQVTLRDTPADDLRRWQRKAETRMAEGKPDKALEFASDVIPGTLAAAVRGALEGVTDATAARGVFDAVLAWEGYP